MIYSHLYSQFCLYALTSKKGSFINPNDVGHAIFSHVHSSRYYNASDSITRKYGVSPYTVFHRLKEISNQDFQQEATHHINMLWSDLYSLIWSDM